VSYVTGNHYVSRCDSVSVSTGSRSSNVETVVFSCDAPPYLLLSCEEKEEGVEESVH
jgi:hypothetical protein